MTQTHQTTPEIIKQSFLYTSTRRGRNLKRRSSNRETFNESKNKRAPVQKKRQWETLECRFLRLRTGGAGRRGKRRGKTITGREPTLTTSENNYRRSFFLVLQRLHKSNPDTIHRNSFKRKTRDDLKNKKTSSIVHSGFKAFKTICLRGTGSLCGQLPL